MDTFLSGLAGGDVTGKARSLRVASLLPLIERALDNETGDVHVGLRMFLADGIHNVIAGCKFVIEGKEILLPTFSASFKRCALLWRLLYQGGNASSQRVLFKLDHGQKFLIKIFNGACLDVKISMGRSNTGADHFILEFCANILQGN